VYTCTLFAYQTGVIAKLGTIHLYVCTHRRAQHCERDAAGFIHGQRSSGEVSHLMLLT
jgi:hypothetical protein